MFPSKSNAKVPLGEQLHDLAFVVVTTMVVGFAHAIRYVLSLGDLITSKRR